MKNLLTKIGKKSKEAFFDKLSSKKTAKLSDVIKKVRADEQGHADVNHGMADQINK